VANGASIAYARPHPRPPYRRAGSNHRWLPQPWLGPGVLGMARGVAAFNLPARVRQLFGVSL
jgi:hypothetical protein